MFSDKIFQYLLSRIWFKIILKIIVLIFVAGGALFAALEYRRAAAPDKNYIDSDRKTDIIYFGDPQYEEWTEEQAKTHCESLGGNFNPCGSACPNPDDICIKVCAMRCEFSKESGRSTVQDFEKSIE